jgi:hypothetical protein
MARMTPAERAELEARLAADDQDDDDYEIEIRDGDKATRMPKSAGAPWLKKHFPDLFEELLGDGAAEDEDGKPAGKIKAVPDDAKPPVHFRRRA